MVNLRLINSFLSFILLFLIIPYWLFNKKYIAIFFLLSSLFVLWFKRFSRNKNLDEKYTTFVLIALWLNMMGEMGLYVNFRYYDKLLHFFIPLGITYLVMFYHKGKNVTYYTIFFSTLGLLGLFEIYEWAITKVFDVEMMGVIHDGSFIISPIDDTLLDLITGSIASIMVISYEKYKKIGLNSNKS